MRKSMNYFLSLFALASIIFLASCGDDTEVPLPGEITLNGNAIVDDTLRGTPGATVYVTPVLGIASDDTITVLNNGNSVSIPSPNTVASGDSIGVVFAANAQAGATATLTFTSGSVNRQLITKVEVAPTNVTAYEAKLVYAPNANMESKTFYSTSDGMLYSYNDVVGSTENVSQAIDFGYFYGSTLGASLMSPDDYTTSANYDLTRWTTRNTTMFRMTGLTSADFDAITAGQGNDIEAQYEANSGGAPANPKRVSQLAAGNVIAFTTSDSRFGLIKVVEIVGATGINDGARIEVKVTNPVE